MNPQAPTLETDKEECAHFMGHCVTKDFARKLERERDEARTRADSKHKLWVSEIAKIIEMEKALLSKDAQIHALREALEKLSNCTEVSLHFPEVDEDLDGMTVAQFVNQALSSPAPEVVPLSKLQEAEADAERLASKFKAFHEALTNSGKTSWQEVKRTGQEMDEALAAHKSRKQNQTLTTLESLTTNNP